MWSVGIFVYIRGDNGEMIKMHIIDFTLDALSDTLCNISTLREPNSIPNNVLLKKTTEAWVWARSYKMKS